MSHIYRIVQNEGRNVATSRPKAVNRPTNRPIPARGSANAVAVDKGPAFTLPTLIRPPLAGPYAFSRIPTPADDNPKIFLLRDPPPTWIFQSVDTGYYIFNHLHVIPNIQTPLSIIQSPHPNGPPTFSATTITNNRVIFSLDTTNGRFIVYFSTR